MGQRLELSEQAGPAPSTRTRPAPATSPPGPASSASNTTGDGNIATGATALQFNTNGHDNVATGGRGDVRSNTSGSDNVAAGLNALYSNTNGTDNVATGVGALLNNTTAANNVASGFSGAREQHHGPRQRRPRGELPGYQHRPAPPNVALGSGAGQNLTTGSHSIDIASPGVAAESGTIRIGIAANQNAAYLAGVWKKTIGGPTKTVVVNKNGRLGTAPAPAAPVSAKAQTISRLRVALRQQRIDNRRQDAAIQRLQQEVRVGN